MTEPGVPDPCAGASPEPAGRRAYPGPARARQPVANQGRAADQRDENRPAHTVVLGGVGPDGHSVGLAVLRAALRANGYRTFFLGTDNDLEDFFQVAEFADAVLISSLDGHALQYVRDFPALQLKYGLHRPLWYIGGNLYIGTDGGAAAFRELGFDRIFVKFVDVSTVLGALQHDLATVAPGPHSWPGPAMALRDAGPRNAGRNAGRDAGPGHNGRRPGGRRRLRRRPSVLSGRPAVLAQWRTGSHARDMDDNARFLALQPSFHAAQQAADAGGLTPLVQPRCGVALVEDQCSLLLSLRGSGAAVLSYQVDSLTRNNNYQAAELAIRESEAAGRSALNGFPIVNHGVPALRSVSATLKTPLQTRHSARDPRLLAEISYAGGVTAFEGGPICYNIPYHKDLPLSSSIARWRYVDCLTGAYADRYGIRIDREFFGVLTATLIPPCIAIAIDIIEMLLAVGHGVKSVSLGYAEQGNRTQDVAAMRVLRMVAERLLRQRGHLDVDVFTVFHQYMAAFPADCGQSARLIQASAATAVLTGATRVLVKTAVEGTGIPTLDENLDGMSNALRGVREAAALDLCEERVRAEEAVIRQEVDCILASVFRCGKGDLAAGVVHGFEKGWLDVPFAPSIHNQGNVVTGRDTEGAVRFLSTGNMQLTRDLRDFHEGKMAERRRAEGLTKSEDYLLVERDVLRVPGGHYDGWPLGG
jgi:methylaspartate mutase epsilon subunit